MDTPEPADATPSEPRAEPPPARRLAWLTTDRLNLLIAACAVAISAASFYATYLQAKAAEKQVRAVTWPLMQFSHGNANEDYDFWIEIGVTNSGVGPAHIKSFSVEYEGERYHNGTELMFACCIPPDAAKPPYETVDAVKQAIGNMYTTVVQNKLVAAGDTVEFLGLPQAGANAAAWDLLNEARWRLRPQICYCSVLGECFESDFHTDPTPVAACT